MHSSVLGLRSGGGGLTAVADCWLGYAPAGSLEQNHWATSRANSFWHRAPDAGLSSPTTGCRHVVGVAAFPQHGSTVEAVIRAADAALYQAKNAGRDQVVVAE